MVMVIDQDCVRAPLLGILTIKTSIIILCAITSPKTLQIPRNKFFAYLYYRRDAETPHAQKVPETERSRRA